LILTYQASSYFEIPNPKPRILIMIPENFLAMETLNPDSKISAPKPFVGKAEAEGLRAASSLSFFFKPDSIALVGASPRPESLSRIILENLKVMGFSGKIYPVNPKYKEILGLKCYASLEDIEENIDIAVLALPASKVLKALRQGLGKIKGAIVISSGFKEIGGAGAALEAELKNLATQSGIRIIGPNCLGIYDTISKVDTFFISQERIKKPASGGLSILTQSGSFASLIVDEIAAEGIGVARIVSYGNRVDVDESECLFFLAEDEATKVVLLYVESVKEGRSFLEAAFRCAAKKPLVAVKVGKMKSGSRAAISHTGAVSGTYEAYKAAFRKCGILEVEGYEELKDACKVLEAYRPGFGKRILILTNGGGIGINIADACESRGLAVVPLSKAKERQLLKKIPPFAATGNPIDLTGQVRDEHYAEALKIAFSGEEYDLAIVAVLWGPPLITEKLVARIKETLEALNKAAKEKRQPQKPVLICSPGGAFTKKLAKKFEAKGLPVFYTPESAARAAAILSVKTSESRNRAF